MYEIQALYTYPIKGCQGVAHHEIFLEDTGVRGSSSYDREWMLVDEKDLFLNQKRAPKLASIRILSTEPLTVEIPGEETLLIVKGAKEPFTAKLYDEFVEVFAASNEVNAAFSRFLGQNLRLVHLAHEHGRQRLRKNTFHTTFTDAYPLHLVNDLSHDAMGEKAPFPRERSRANIYFRGQRPFEEMSWGSITINGRKIVVEKECERCLVINVDQQTGAKDDPKGSPLGILSKVYKEKTGQKGVNNFGIYLSYENPMRLRVGDKFTPEVMP